MAEEATDFDPTPNIFCEFAAVTKHSEALLSSPSLELMKVTQYREAKTNSHIFQDLGSHSPLWQDLGSPSRHVDSTGCSTLTLDLTAVRSCQLMIGKSDFLVAKQDVGCWYKRSKDLNWGRGCPFLWSEHKSDFTKWDSAKWDRGRRANRAEGCFYGFAARP